MHYLMKPVLQALLVADHVYTDKLTGKYIIAGVFQALFFKKKEPVIEQDIKAGKTSMGVPLGGGQAGSPFCYISLTDVRDKQDFELHYVALVDNKSLFSTGFTVECNDPLSIVQLSLPLPALPYDKPGVYALELLWNNELLGSHKIVVSELAESEESDE